MAQDLLMNLHHSITIREKIMGCQYLAGRRTGGENGAVGDLHRKETVLQFESRTNAFPGDLS